MESQTRVNNIQFSAGTSYVCEGNVVPVWTDTDPT